MRPFLLAFVLLAAPAWAAPEIRWLDETGGVRTAAITSVLEENGLQVRVELAEGGEKRIATRMLLTLVRENDKDRWQAALLDARGAVYLGGGAGAARKALDTLAREGTEAWIKEYAAIHRALLAGRTGEKDAAARLDNALKDYPASRFRSHLLLARAKVDFLAEKNEVIAQSRIGKAFEKIEASNGPLIVAFQCHIVGATRLAWEKPGAFGAFQQGMRQRYAHKLGENPDAALSTVMMSTFKWMMLVLWRHRYDLALDNGAKPYGARDGVFRLLRQSQFLLPELRSDLAYELGRMHKACGDADKAEAAFDLSLKLAPDPWRRKRATRR